MKFLHLKFFITFILQPLLGNDLADDIVYADLNDNDNYGPINYKAASIYALVKKSKAGELKETTT